MSTALVPWTDPRVITVRRGPDRPCHVEWCERPAVAYVVTLDMNAGDVCTSEVCRPHHDLARDLGGALLSPLAGPPPNLDRIAQAVKAHLGRQRRSDMYGRRHPTATFTTTFQGGFYGGTGTTGGWYR